MQPNATSGKSCIYRSTSWSNHLDNSQLSKHVSVTLMLDSMPDRWHFTQLLGSLGGVIMTKYPAL